MALTREQQEAIFRTGQRQFEILVFAVSFLVVTLAVVMHATPDWVFLLGHRVPTMCLWRNLTGMSCPGCGMTRSFVFVAHGHPLDALHCNLLGPPLFVIVAAQVPYRALRLWRARRGRG